jgi:hypothetical protein
VAGDIINIDFNPEIKDMQIMVEKPEQPALLQATNESTE